MLYVVASYTIEEKRVVYTIYCIVYSVYCIVWIHLLYYDMFLYSLWPQNFSLPGKGAVWLKHLLYYDMFQYEFKMPAYRENGAV